MRRGVMAHIYIYRDEENGFKVSQGDHTVQLVSYEASDSVVKFLTPEEAMRLASALTIAATAILDAKKKE
jgi:hypothetical protein